jgi:tRNA threonylcarbamoyladenosine modification (KEOPS) complex  Pcc1 subunit
VFRSIADADCPEVADTFYEHIFNENLSTGMIASSVDTTQAARALHLAVAKLRSEGASFIRWVPFVYLGR